MCWVKQYTYFIGDMNFLMVQKMGFFWFTLLLFKKKLRSILF